ncbi:MAG: T9SS type A sorting domain-containing protein [bacterium]|nr:T9SS type A sorting domain-containing protein [bacterium]
MKPSLIVLVLVTAAFGQYIDDFPWSEPTYIIDSEHRDYQPVVGYTPDDEMFVVWFSAWATHYYDVSFAKVAEDGSLSIEPTRIFTEDGVDDRAATVAVDSQNHAHIFWRRQTGGEFNIWYTQVDAADGSYLVDPVQLIDSNTPSDIFMYAVPDLNDNIHLLYCSNSWDGERWWDQPFHAVVSPDGVLLGYDQAVTDDSAYESVSFDKGIACDSDGNVHVVYTYFNNTDPVDYSIIYRKIDGDDGTWLTPLIDLGYPTKGDNSLLAHEPDDRRPAICIDDQERVYVSYIHFEDYITNITNVILNTDSEVLREPQLIYSEEGNGFTESNYFYSKTGRILLFNDSYIGIAVFEFDTDGNLIDGPYYMDDEMLFGHFEVGPYGAVGDSGYIRVVGQHRVDDWDYDVMYVHQIDDSTIDETLLKAYPDDDGILLSWQEDGELIGSTWRLEREGERLVNLSGDALYRYLDRDAEPNVTHLYTLEATLPDGSVRRFGPVEAAWPGPDADRFTLYAPYPCPATDVVTLSYYLPENTENVELSLYDLSGRLVESSVSVPTSPGRHEVEFDAAALTAGVYLYRLTAGDATLTRRMVVSR